MKIRIILFICMLGWFADSYSQAKDLMIKFEYGLSKNHFRLESVNGSRILNFGSGFEEQMKLSLRYNILNSLFVGLGVGSRLYSVSLHDHQGSVLGHSMGDFYPIGVELGGIKNKHRFRITYGVSFSGYCSYCSSNPHYIIFSSWTTDSKEYKYTFDKNGSFFSNRMNFEGTVFFGLDYPISKRLSIGADAGLYGSFRENFHWTMNEYAISDGRWTNTYELSGSPYGYYFGLNLGYSIKKKLE